MAFAYTRTDKYQQLVPAHRYHIREKIFSLGDKLKIKDESGQDVFVVRSKIWTLGTKIMLEDMAENVLIKIRGEPLSHDSYTIWSTRTGESEQQLASIKKKFSWKQKFKIQSIYGEYKLKELDMLSRSFTLTKKDGQRVAIVSKNFSGMADTYEVEIVDMNEENQAEDHAFILALIIILHCTIYSEFCPIVIP